MPAELWRFNPPDPKEPLAAVVGAKAPVVPVPEIPVDPEVAPVVPVAAGSFGGANIELVADPIGAVDVVVDPTSGFILPPKLGTLWLFETVFVDVVAPFVLVVKSPLMAVLLFVPVPAELLNNEPAGWVLFVVVGVNLFENNDAALFVAVVVVAVAGAGAVDVLGWANEMPGLALFVPNSVPVELLVVAAGWPVIPKFGCGWLAVFVPAKKLPVVFENTDGCAAGCVLLADPPNGLVPVILDIPKLLAAPVAPVVPVLPVIPVEVFVH
jgi:hypothetical protein